MPRRLGLEDMDRAAAVHRASFDHALPAHAGLHTPEEERSFFRERTFATCQLWGYFDNQLIGIIAFREGWVDQLYVLASSQRRGIGAALLAIAPGQFPSLSLRTFQRNKAALGFYEKQGFTLAKEKLVQLRVTAWDRDIRERQDFDDRFDGEIVVVGHPNRATLGTGKIGSFYESGERWRTPGKRL